MFSEEVVVADIFCENETYFFLDSKEVSEKLNFCSAVKCVHPHAFLERNKFEFFEHSPKSVALRSSQVGNIKKNEAPEPIPFLWMVNLVSDLL